MSKRTSLSFLLVASIFLTQFVNSFVFAEQVGSSPESGSSSRIKTIYDSLTSSSFGSTSAGAWGDWGSMWNRIYSASLWSPDGTTTVGNTSTGKTFYNSSRVLQTGQGSLLPTPTPVTPAVGDASRFNTLYKAIKTTSYGLESAGVWGDWGTMFNRTYSSSTWTPSDANAAIADVVTGQTFYSGNNRTIKTGTSLSNGSVCVNSSDCFTGTCTTFYQDSDSDTYGNANVTTKRCGATYTGYVTNSTDCGPSTATAYPGSATCSTTSFLNASGAASYDYNCNGSGTSVGCSILTHNASGSVVGWTARTGACQNCNVSCGGGSNTIYTAASIGCGSVGAACTNYSGCQGGSCSRPAGKMCGSYPACADYNGTSPTCGLCNGISVATQACN